MAHKWGISSPRSLLSETAVLWCKELRGKVLMSIRRTGGSSGAKFLSASLMRNRATKKGATHGHPTPTPGRIMILRLAPAASWA